MIGPMSTPATPRPVSMNEAARLTGLSVSTLRRRRAELRDHGATQHPNGSWSIPIHTLVALGLLDNVTTPEDDATTEPPPALLAAEVADLRVEVEKERGLRLAAEREVQAITAHLATAQNTIRMIEAAPPKIETRVERVEVPRRVEVEVPVVPRSIWAVLTVLLFALAALLAWTLLGRADHNAAPAHPVTSSTPTTPTDPIASVPVAVPADPTVPVASVPPTP